MSDAETKNLIDRLQRTNRRWKMFALISTSFLAVLFLATGVSIVVQWKRAEAEREMVLRMVNEATVMDEQQRREAEERAEKALKAAEEAIKEWVDRAKKKEQ